MSLSSSKKLGPGHKQIKPTNYCKPRQASQGKHYLSLSPRHFSWRNRVDLLSPSKVKLLNYYSGYQWTRNGDEVGKGITCRAPGCNFVSVPTKKKATVLVLFNGELFCSNDDQSILETSS